MKRNMPKSHRVAVLLLAADIANKTIMVSHPESFDVCKQAIQKCREWLNGNSIAPEALAAHIDADEAAQIRGQVLH